MIDLARATDNDAEYVIARYIPLLSLEYAGGRESSDH
jgi:hypothetical protein